MMSKFCLYKLKQPTWEVYNILRHGKWDYEWFRFKNLAYGLHRDYYDGWHMALNTGFLNIYVYW